MRPLLSDYARKRKIVYFLDTMPKDAEILEIGCGGGWVGDYLQDHGWTHYTGMDLHPPADVIGDIRNWRTLGMEPETYDVIIAFETLEHVDCVRDCYVLLKPGGVLMATSPVPSRDWIMRLLEWCRLNQKRHEPHDHLVILEKAPYFEYRAVRVVAGLAQWAILTKATTGYLSEVNATTTDVR